MYVVIAVRTVLGIYSCLLWNNFKTIYIQDDHRVDTDLVQASDFSLLENAGRRQSRIHYSH